MKVNIIGKKIEITEGIRENIIASLSKLDKYFKNEEKTADVVIKTYAIGQKIEITLPLDKHHTLRQEVVERDLYQAINEATDKIEKQIRKVKDRASDRREEKVDFLSILSEFEKAKEAPVQITRRKSLELKPMSEEEAILQFELVGHDFYLFEDASSEETKVLYKRKEGSYGVIIV